MVPVTSNIPPPQPNPKRGWLPVFCFIVEYDWDVQDEVFIGICKNQKYYINRTMIRCKIPDINKRLTGGHTSRWHGSFPREKTERASSEELRKSCRSKGDFMFTHHHQMNSSRNVWSDILSPFSNLLKTSSYRKRTCISWIASCLPEVLPAFAKHLLDVHKPGQEGKGYPSVSSITSMGAMWPFRTSCKLGQVKVWMSLLDHRVLLKLLSFPKCQSHCLIIIPQNRIFSIQQA